MIRCCGWCVLAAFGGWVLGLGAVAAVLLFGPDLDKHLMGF